MPAAASLPFGLDEGLTPTLDASTLVHDVPVPDVDPTSILDPSIVDPSHLIDGATQGLGDVVTDTVTQGVSDTAGSAAETGAHVGTDIALCVVGAFFGGNC